MMLFTIKKTFFDLWDHLFSIVLLNLGATLIVGVGISLPYALNFHPSLSLLGIVIGIFLLTLYIGAASKLTQDIADYKSLSIRVFFQYLKDMWKAASVLSVIIIIQVVLFVFVLPWYIRQGGIFGIAAASVIFWGSVFWWWSVSTISG